MDDANSQPSFTDVLVMRGVRKTYEAEGVPVRALRGADLTLGLGEFAAVMGPSGCGKSTLLNVVAGLDQADEGQIVLAGEEVTGRSEDDLARMRRRHIGIVFQFFNLLEGMSALENVVLPAVVAGCARKKAEPVPATCSTCSGSATRPRRRPACCRVVNGNGWPSPGRWPTSPPCSWPTSPPVRSIRRVATR